MKHFPITNPKHLYLLLLLLHYWSMRSNRTKLLKQFQVTPGIRGTPAAIKLVESYAFIVQDKITLTRKNMK